MQIKQTKGVILCVDNHRQVILLYSLHPIFLKEVLATFLLCFCRVTETLVKVCEN